MISALGRQVAARTGEAAPVAGTNGSRPPLVSVVIPTYCRVNLLRRCLAAVCDAAAGFDPGAVEVIVADDAADEETRRCVESFILRGPKLRYLPVRGGHGPAAARNSGWRAARGEIIAFTDDDCVPDRNWLVAGLAPFESLQVLGVSGRLVMPISERSRHYPVAVRTGGSALATFTAPRLPTDYELNAAQLTRAEFVTANCFYRKQALELVGGFDERFRIAWREDSDLYFTLLERSNGSGPAAFVRAPDAIVLHPIRPAPWGVSISQQSRNRYNALLYKKHARLYRERLAPVTPWRYYGIAGSLLVLIAGTVLGKASVQKLGALAWVALTGQFVARRLRGTSREPGRVAELLVTSAIIPPVALYWRLRGALEYRARFL